MRVALSLLCIASGCGRIAFDPLSSGSNGDAGGDDGALAACATTAEVCNGIDDNCNGAIDEGCPCAPWSNQKLQQFMIGAPALVWTGNGYLLERIEATGLGVSPVDATTGSFGTFHPLIPPTGFAISTMNARTLAWAGTEGAFVWTASGGAPVLFRRIDASGVPLMPAAMIASVATSGSIKIAWAEDRYVVAYTDGGGIVQVREVPRDFDGSQPLTTIMNGPFSDATVTDIAVTPSTYAITVTSMSGTVNVLGIDRVNGTSWRSSTGIAAAGVQAQVVSSGGTFIMTRSTQGNVTLFDRLDATGVPQPPATLLVAPGKPIQFVAAAAASDGYRISEVISDLAGTLDARVLVFDAAGAPVGVPEPLVMSFAISSFAGDSLTAAQGRVGHVLVYQSAATSFVTVHQICE